VLVGGGVQVVEDDLLHLLLDLLRLTENDITLPLDGALLELGVLKDVLQDVDALGNVLVEGLGKVDGVLALFRGLAVDRGPEIEYHEPRCRRSGGRPCSRSRAPIAAASASRYPVGEVKVVSRLL